MLPALIAACRGPEDASDSETGGRHSGVDTGTDGPSCTSTPCVGEVADFRWTPPADTLRAGYDLARVDGVLYVGAPGPIGAEGGPWRPRAVAVVLPSMQTLGSWEARLQVDGTGYAVAAADLDHDGLAEVAVGAYNRQVSAELTGSVFLVRGVPDGEQQIEPSASLTFTSPHFVFAGIAVGFADLVDGVGAELLTSGFGSYPEVPGRVYVIDPTLRGELREEDATVIVRGQPGLGEDIVTWDADADGQVDLVASLSLGSGLGWFPGPLLPGELSEEDHVGRWTGRPDHPGDCLGDTLEAIGDVTGDGLADLTLAAPNYAGAVDRVGRAYVVPAGDLQPGPADDLAIQVHGGELGEAMGYGLSSGDVDGDGQHDLLVGAPGISPGVMPGRLLVFLGPVGGVLDDEDAAAVLHGERDHDQLGRAILAYDADGDGQDDVLVSAIGSDDDQGAVYLVPGSALLP